MNAAIDIRTVRDDDHDLTEWSRAVHTGFLSPPVEDDVSKILAFLRGLAFDPSRIIGAWEGDHCVGTYRTYGFELTTPGGGSVPMAGVSAVTVQPTHRRRGLLRRMMTAGLEDAVRRGEPLAGLYAAEHGIYGRFGFGRAVANEVGYDVDLNRSGGLRAEVGALAPGARIDLASMAELRKIGPGLHERWRRTQPGTVNRLPDIWKVLTGELPGPGSDKPFEPPFVAVHRDASGTVTGLAVYAVERRFENGTPDGVLKVDKLFALDTATEQALWRYLSEVDWVRHLKVPRLQPDSALPLLLVNPRGARRTEAPSEWLWLRILDPEQVFNGRAYRRVPGRTVFEVADALGYAAGTWVLETDGEGGGRLTRAAQGTAADLALDVSAWSALCLGGESTPRLVEAGLVQELTPGAVELADLQLRTSAAPFCSDGF
ncbi:hypothetical protein BIV57_06405 [Mangrovactinospora gilvigrisea]|uniref:N-acetyltransferase domain-containing protein n=1 Tax=Mangrovactinospora gilvigrisea TaxID=1428644 RepID=A0A1J7BI80_9ACTN|nr:GNAT family N-acetyltransferase [Mangrovactinospora gilvigrisea]OIV38293.1 hypothetical protein BIV57_06405 [Mangrovactinospora gilvigrisea]